MVGRAWWMEKAGWRVVLWSVHFALCVFHFALPLRSSVHSVRYVVANQSNVAECIIVPNRQLPVPHQKVASSGPKSCQFRTKKLPVPQQKVASFPHSCHILKDLCENWWKKSSRDKTACALQPAQLAPQCAQMEVRSSFIIHHSSSMRTFPLFPGPDVLVPRDCPPQRGGTWCVMGVSPSSPWCATLTTGIPRWYWCSSFSDSLEVIRACDRATH